MYEIRNSDIFTEDSINIFTDASILRYKKGEFVGCAGCILVLGKLEDNNIVEDYQVIRNSTNNDSELKAIRLGIQTVIPYINQYRTIRLFSDSQISVFGIRERIFNWKFHNGKYYNNQNTPVANQNVMMEIINLILSYNLNIEIYHQKGHVKYTMDCMMNAARVFEASNGTKANPSMEFIKAISLFNNMVDNKSREVLHNTNLKEYRNIEPLIFYPTEFNQVEYLSHIRHTSLIQ